MIRVIATLPPYVDHRRSIIDHPRVDELRFNTISPLAESRRDVVARLARECGAKRLWLDLKGRQLRITRFAYLPYAYVQVSHRLRVDLPVEVHFRDCVSQAVEIVDGDKLILSRRPARVVGEGEPINILHPSLRIEGTLTESDREYVEAARRHGLHDYMLSFVEKPEDIAELESLDPDARIVAKIESRRGLDLVRRADPDLAGRVRLAAARDDLFVELGPAKVDYLDALRSIVAADPGAIAASRLLTSLERGDPLAGEDLTDVWLLLSLGYRTLMLGDMLCFHRESFCGAIEVLADLLGREAAVGAIARPGSAPRRRTVGSRRPRTRDRG
jgi:pyruvate kinase